MDDERRSRLSAEAQAVVDTFVASYPGYVVGRLTEEAATWPDMELAVASGTDWLQRQLEMLLALDYRRQTRGPLELFQESMRFPTEVLSAHGVAEPDRHQVEETALPGDRYGLAPASSQDLGEAAWRAHAAFGIAKARAVAAAVPAREASRRPSVALVSIKPADREIVAAAGRARGLTVQVWRNPTAVTEGLAGGRPLVAIVDVENASACELIPQIAATGAPVLAVGSDVDDLQEAALRGLGASLVVERSRLEIEIGRHLPRLA